MIQKSHTQSRRDTKGGGDCGPAVLRGFVPSCESGPFSITGSGTHTIRWKYIKGSSGSAGSDCLWIDNVRWSGAMPDVNEIEYVYDLSGRRIEKKVDGMTELKFLYDGDHILAEYDANDTLLRKYVHGPSIDEPICLIESSGDYAGTQYYHYDALGSVVALTNSSGSVTQLYEYSVYGQVAASDANHPNRFMFTGREFDKDTGLYYYRARYYNPEIGRFLQTDPIGYGDGMNWYAYCENNPLIGRDPSGLYSELEWFAKHIMSGTFYVLWQYEEGATWLYELGPGDRGSWTLAKLANWLGFDPSMFLAAEIPGYGAGYVIQGHVPEPRYCKPNAGRRGGTFKEIGYNLSIVPQYGYNPQESTQAGIEMDDLLNGELGHMLGANGATVRSVTLWEGDGRLTGARIDVENNAPGRRPGEVHFHPAEKGQPKTRFNPSTRRFDGLSNTMNGILLRDEAVRRAIERGMRKYLGEVNWGW